MANPKGNNQQTDPEVWALPFFFTIGAAGVVSTAANSFKLPAEIVSVARTASAGVYTFTLKEKWSTAVCIEGAGIQTAYNKLHLAADNVTGSPPTLTVHTLTESGGVTAPADLTNGTRVGGILYLRNKA